jgi:hypothetical protein
MNKDLTLSAEWERLDLLAACVAMSRRGETIPEETQTRLETLQQRVLELRQTPPWQTVITENNLTLLDQDILACVLGPVAEPKLGWMFQELQPGITSTYPTPALMQELYFMSEVEAGQLYERLSSASPLVAGGLLELTTLDAYTPLKPTHFTKKALLGWSSLPIQAPPGTLEITEAGSWDDLVLPEYCLRGLHEFLLWSTQRKRVVDEWGGKPSGGPVALFVGPSGTGKTFSATIIANALGWPLFRVDLGMLVSKYIGETEKNLNALFEAAHRQHMVLLFDEAESLFGKRGEVKEARDRFANMEVSHLLSRIERHQGPCILTSNLREQLDPAFARRFQLVLEFPRPDSESREMLWRKHLPPRAPYEREVEPPLLGTALNLTGGQIRNAALHAAYLAAGENRPVNLRHIARAVWNELAKEGKEVMTSSLGILANYLEGGKAYVSH